MLDLEQLLYNPRLWASVGIGAGVLVLSALLSRASKRYIRQARLEGKRVTNAQVGISLLKYTIYIFALFIILQINGVNIGSLAASLGLVSAALVFAVQDVLKDLIMGFNIRSSEFFSVGDVVKYGEIYGIVQSFNLRATQIYDVNTGNIFSVCNRDITQIERVSDWLDINIPTGYKENVEKVRAVCRELCQEFMNIPEVTECQFLGTDAFKDSFVQYRIRIHCPPERRAPTRRAALGIVQDVFRRRSLAVPFPQMDVHLEANAPRKEQDTAILADGSAKPAAELELRRFSKGQVIFKEGDWASEMYDIVQGSVSIYADFGKPSQRLLTTLGAGKYFGEMGLVETMPRSATAVAEEDTEVRVVTGKELDGWFRQNPDQVTEIMTHLSRRTRELTADYMEVCRTVAEMQDVESAGQEKSPGLMERVRRFAGFWRNNG